MGNHQDGVHDIIRSLLTKHPDAPARLIARMVAQECRGALTIEQARSRVRRVLGVCGKRHRNKRVWGKEFYRNRRKAGAVPPLPPSKAEEWTPYLMDIVGRVGVLSDIHLPYHDPTALAAAIQHLQRVKIDALLLNGDIADFYTISHWMKRPKLRDFPGELKAVREFLSHLRGTFQGIPIAYKLGNHEERWEKWLFAHAPEISDEPEMGLDVWLKTERHGITIIDQQRIVMLGKLPVFHGHELPRGISSPVNPARGAFMRLKHTGLVAHQHQTSGHCEPDVFHEETFCWSVGCLCNLTPAFARINRWNHGLAVIDVERDGQFNVNNLRITPAGTVRSS